MQDLSVCLRLERQQQVIDLVVEVGRVGEQLGEIAEQEGPYGRLLVVVLDVDVDDVRRLTEDVPAGVEPLQGLVVDALFRGQDDVEPNAESVEYVR